MKRPFMSVMEYNATRFIGIGSCWALEATLELLEKSPLIIDIQAIVFVIMILLFLYTSFCEHERGDERSETNQNEAYAAGLHVLFVIAVSYLLLSKFFGVIVQLQFAVYLLLGAGYLTVGVFFYLLERLGNI